jgi:hypothetical protein
LRWEAPQLHELVVLMVVPQLIGNELPCTKEVNPFFNQERSYSGGACDFA